MRPSKIDVSYQAKVQVSRLSKTEKDQLNLLFDDPDLLAKVSKQIPSGNTISLLGETKRVLWKMSPDGKPVILSVAEQVLSN